MFPSIVANQVRQGVVDFLGTTFPINSRFFEGILPRFLANEGEQVFKGPYLSVKLPFRPGRLGRKVIPGLNLAHHPHLHQEKSFERLLRGDSTLVATGTGSGKTECFMFPLLEYCRKAAPAPGIKAIVIYPMNALANDQAKRFAKTVAQDPALKGLRVGMYVGSQGKDGGNAVMAEDQVITDKDILRQNPPDILLTNYKMLDYMLVRPKDAAIWKDNLPDTLKFIIVDELHSFDGAQGTDLACLIRRVKARLVTPKKHLCCVGTSATLGDDDREQLRNYAADIFDEAFSDDAIITEDLLRPDEFFGSSLIDTDLPSPFDAEAEQLDPSVYDHADDYLRQQYRLWFGEEVNDLHDRAWREQLGEDLKRHPVFRNLLTLLGTKPIKLTELISSFAAQARAFRKAPPLQQEALLCSLLSLLSWSRKGGKTFLQLRHQLWMRELRRLVGEIKLTPALRFSADLKGDEAIKHLPLVHCRDCAALGWMGLKRPQDEQLATELDQIYRAFFARSPDIGFAFPGETIPSRQDSLFRDWLCGKCLRVEHKAGKSDCSCGERENLIEIAWHNPRTPNSAGVAKGSHDCPFCDSKRSLTIVGSQAASLISVANSVIFASGYNDDKKLLTFSDSVQDAAQRAGFFTARTYHFNLRAALQQFLEQRPADAPLLTLPQLGEAFCNFYLKQWPDEEFITKLLPPDLAWLEDYEDMKKQGKLKKDSKLLSDLRSRLEYEIYRELSLRCRIGRTLEKSGGAIAAFDDEAIAAVIASCAESLRNRNGHLRSASDAQFGHFIAGFLVAMKNHGAVSLPILQPIIKLQGAPWLWNKNPINLNFGKHQVPRFLCNEPGEFVSRLIGSGGALTWPEAWMGRCFGLGLQEIRLASTDFFNTLIKAMEEQGLILREDLDKALVWGLNPDKMKVHPLCREVICDTCGHRSSKGPANELLNGAPCPRKSCAGHLESQAAGKDYYGHFYSEADIERIFAREHSGLLERSVREELESEFMALDDNRQPWFPNLLSCTPTLEMGVDIGDLSSAILCSVPPAQANYLQRIGRTGRRDGNSFNLAVAAAKPHDLYFYADPMDMMAGKVEAPGCFLNAPAVLERQFTAFVFDNWVKSGVAISVIPDKLGKVLDAVEKKQQSQFPYNFLAYLGLHRQALITRFFDLFPKLQEEGKERLRCFVEGSETIGTGASMDYRMVNRLQEMSLERKRLVSRVKAIDTEKKKLENDAARPADYENRISDLEDEKAALNSLASSLVGKQTYNFLTDEGLLPNYAFPEAGVTLRSVILRRRRDGAPQKESRSIVYEYERPGSNALRELAPSNNFYAEGRKVTIDQVDMRLSTLETWRFCAHCSHMEAEPGEAKPAQACPACGSPQWNDAQQRRTMIKLRQVLATTKDKDSRIGDDSDDRDTVFFDRNLIVDPVDAKPEKAYKLDTAELPFGFEFRKRVDFREVNFGPKEALIGQTLKIANREVQEKAFLLCRDCGRVQGVNEGVWIDGKPSEEELHAFNCKHRQSASTSKSACINAVFLYREFQSEAIRILLPLASFAGSESSLQSFVAAVTLGLKQKFRGSIDHINSTIQEVPIPESDIPKRFLVLFDQVPGGTGYLKELMDRPESMMELFQKAYEKIQACACAQDPHRDGCYRCLYAYRSSFEMNKISRRAALDMLQRILGHRDKLVPTDDIDSIPVNILFESELEALFIEGLRKGKSGKIQARLKEDVVNKKTGYRLQLGERLWFVEPQVELGPEQGISLNCRPDFVMRPDDPAVSLPIAIFTDGFSYHGDASQRQSRIADDLKKRLALIRSGRFLVWSLTWDDVNNFVNPNKKSPPADKFLRNSNLLDKMIGAWEKKAPGISALRALPQEESFEQLLRYLSQPDAQCWALYAGLQAFHEFGKDRYAANMPEALRARINDDEFHSDKISALTPQPEGEFLASWRLETYADGQPKLALAAHLPFADAAANQLTKVRVALRFFDELKVAGKPEFKAAWNGMLALCNLLQFLPEPWQVSTLGLQQGSFAALEFVSPAPKAALSTELPAEVIELLEVAAAEARPYIEHCHWQGLPLPIVGYEICGERKSVIAEVELAWPEQQLALVLTEDEVAPLLALAWRAFTLSSLSPEQLAQHLTPSH